ncbi:hypothetical protein [Riemerella columbina]|uniref:hypothetical protein n=1 Tax=Riemerella columbina TaxID=103810 RepID=UPI0003631E56|nr:hypothetical protein [Riemerella columbina]
MKRIIFLLISFLVLSCSVRKHKTVDTVDIKQETELKSDETIEKKSISLLNNLTEVQDKKLNFSIEPICGQPAEFDFWKDGERYQGKTNSKLTFNSESSKKKEENNASINEDEKKHTEDQFGYKYIYKDKIVEIDVERKIPFVNWLCIIALTIGIWELLKWVIKSKLKFLWIK